MNFYTAQNDSFLSQRESNVYKEEEREKTYHCYEEYRRCRPDDKLIDAEQTNKVSTRSNKDRLTISYHIIHLLAMPTNERETVMACCKTKETKKEKSDISDLPSY